MGKMQFCRICRTEKNLKFTKKELKELNKKRSQGLEAEDKASKKLLRTTQTLGNICKDCDLRVQIFHRLDDVHPYSDSDIEIDVVDDDTNSSLPPAALLPSLTNINSCRPETPVIVDDDEMLYDLFMQKVDQQRQQKQQPTQYTPPQSTGGSEGDDAKVFEVLTSRESTPASIAPTETALPESTLPPNVIDKEGHRIVAIIDLDDADSEDYSKRESEFKYNSNDVHSTKSFLNNSQDQVLASATFQTALNGNQLQLTPIKTPEVQSQATEFRQKDDDDEEIIFRRVDSRLETPPSKKKKRKSYDDKQLRLVASLSLISSDSEDEADAAPSTLVASPTYFSCKQCKIKLPDQESLAVHERIHEGIKCPVCDFGYSRELRLVNHMRTKHRNYSGNALMEKPRSPQDSAMTIRLRYMNRLTYYECQLCGRIDAIFKDHKDHIINKHPIESKKLKDPIMKQLKCPICNVKCGGQYLSLCRHLLANHEPAQYKSHLRELLHVSAFGWSTARQQEVAKYARIFQFTKRKSFFFECKKCRTVVAGYLNHLKHATNHRKLERKEKDDARKLSSSLNSSAITTKTKNKKQQLTKTLESTKQIKNTLQKGLKSCTSTSKSVNKSQTLKKTLTPKNGSINNKLTNSKIKSKEKPIFIKPKTPDIVQSTKKTNKRKLKDNVAGKTQTKKSKIKAPIRQILLQTYTCIDCSKIFKGFLLYNMHILQEHNPNEFEQCVKCNQRYLDKLTLQSHAKKCSALCAYSNKQKRKRCRDDENQCENIIHDKRLEEDNQIEGDKEKVPEIKLTELVPDFKENGNNPEHKETLWLRDLLNLYESKNNENRDIGIESSIRNVLTNTAATSCPKTQKNEVLQCFYCLQLFSSQTVLKDHIRAEHSENVQALIKYTPINVKI